MTLKERVTLNTSEYGFMPWPQRLAHFRAFGFRFLEVGTLPKVSDAKFREFLKLIQDGSMEIVAMHDWYGFFSAKTEQEKQDARRRFQSNIARTAQAGAKNLIWYTRDNPTLHGLQAVDDLLLRLEPLLAQAAKAEVNLLLENEFSSQGDDPAAHRDAATVAPANDDGRTLPSRGRPEIT